MPERRDLAGMKDVPKAIEAVWKIESNGSSPPLPESPTDSSDEAKKKK
jgi:hypothetical protein